MALECPTHALAELRQRDALHLLRLHYLADAGRPRYEQLCGDLGIVPHLADFRTAQRIAAEVRSPTLPVAEFLARVADKFEVVIMTAGVRPYASLVLDLLDTGRVLGPRFYRESCTKTANGLLVKDLSRMNRDLKRTIIVDNSPNAYLWHPEHAIDVVDFVGDPEDDELKTIADFLDVIHDVDDVRQHVAHWRSGGAYELPPNARADAPNRAALAKEAKAAGN